MASIKRHLSAWLPVAFWLCVIAFESTDMMSSEHTGHWLYAFIRSIFGPVNPQYFEIFHFFLRKAGHFVGYGILSLLCLRALRMTFVSTLLRFSAAAIAFTAAVASLDEWHQSFIPSRTGTAHDVLLDTFAAICAQVAVALILRNQSRLADLSPVPCLTSPENGKIRRRRSL